MLNAEIQCHTDVFLFVTNNQGSVLQGALMKLNREQTPDLENIGALFADRIVVQCG